MYFTLQISQGDESLIGTFPEIAEVVTQGTTVEEVMMNSLDALDLFLQNFLKSELMKNLSEDNTPIHPTISTRTLEFCLVFTSRYDLILNQKQQDNWYEIWVDESHTKPYILLLQPVNNLFEITDPSQENRKVFESCSYEEARIWLLEDEFICFGRKQTND
ncbi:type II toxin-antitoxin system HicB family antitoxin [Dyadobacter luticola]|uniref:Type II toxin-antitoxin system HicB family antitoxin n=1 Tax=Dyadobacter luticola TaxID=1979387 RepID=A0A5R9KTL5_9BACT|nr:hypothetical protein [Dyadobacter luticola]TLU99444.1 hypothetical protein FEN17_23080 [Dyadobacter luticola]